MFPLVSALTILPVLFIGYVAHDSYALMLLGGFVLGLGGTTFAIGIPLVNEWFPPARRGTALGIFGAGMGGTAIAAFSTVQLKNAFGLHVPVHRSSRSLLAVFAVVGYLVLRDAPGRTVHTGSVLRRTWDTFRMPVTLQMSFLYAVGFGGFVAFSVYLPTYLRDAFGLSPADAALRTAGFVVLAVIMRPVGGWLSDRFHPVPVLVGCFAVVTVFAGGLGPGAAAGVGRARSPSSPWPPRSAPPRVRCSPWSPSRRPRARSARSPASSAQPAGSAASSRR